MQLDEKYGLRGVELAEVAEYLRCDPKRLQIALDHLAASPTVVMVSPSSIVTIASINQILPVVDIVMRMNMDRDADQEAKTETHREVREALDEGPIVTTASINRITVEEVTLRVNKNRYKRMLEGKPDTDTSPIDPQAAKWLN